MRTKGCCGNRGLTKRASVPQGIVTDVRVIGQPGITGDVILVPGSNILLTQSGHEITITEQGGIPSKIDWAEDTAKSAQGTTEVILYEYLMNFDDVAANIQARLSAILNRGAVAGTATFKLYTGAAAPGNTAGGTVRATITTVSAVDEIGATTTDLGAAFVNPGGRVLVQITGVHTDALGIANIRGLEAAIG